MVIDWIVLHSKWLLRFSEANKLDRNRPALVQKLEETMLAVGAWLSEINNCCGVLNNFSFSVYSLAIALHIELLDMGCQFAESLTIWYDGPCRVALYCSSVEPYQT